MERFTHTSLMLLVSGVFASSVWAQSPSQRPARTYATHIDYPGPRTVPIEQRLGASAYVYLHSLPAHLDDSRRRYRSRLFLTVDPIVPSRLLSQLPDHRHRTELELLWTARRAQDRIGGTLSTFNADTDPWLLLGQRRFLNAGERFINEAIESPDDPSPKLGYALAMLAKGDVHGAQFALSKAIELSESIPMLSALKGDAAHDLLREIADSLRSAADRFPHQASILLSLAIVLSVDGQPGCALEYAHRAHELSPLDPVPARLIELLDVPELQK